MKNKKAQILDVPLIQKKISLKHQLFVKEYGDIIDKVMSDHKLFTDIIIAKLHRILVIFKEESIIDDIKIADQGPSRKIILNKDGYDTYIELETNGMAITMRGYTYNIVFEEEFRHNKEMIEDVNNEDFDWVAFSVQLLDYIHSTIYRRKEVIEQKITRSIS